ncbi:hypothetical protein GPX89_19765 [Nocardia sp. ET3-3]|uniref:Uncharacterized protein n=1 Tax=Nocardia terrae TaxID=2675851 RepID=A0A7K1UYL9_9NOCA|nr:hypothetical protein [Nocardia terrae]MVU79473.1 hypothetical protein [Nocardia terrae]
MSALDKGHSDIRTLAAEEQRLAVTEGVLSDLLAAALDVMERGDRRGWGGARQKRDHWDATHESVRTDRDSAADAYHEALLGRNSMETIRAARENVARAHRGIGRSR